MSDNLELLADELPELDLQTVLSFAKEPVDKLSESKRRNLSQYFKTIPLMRMYMDKGAFDAVPPEDVVVAGVSGILQPKWTRGLTLAELRAMQRKLREVLDRLIPREPVPPAPQVAARAVTIAELHREVKGRDWIVPATVKEIRVSTETLQRRFLVEWPGSFWLSVAELLCEFRGRLARCANAKCGAVFLKPRSDSRFCSDPCSQKIRSKQYYDANKKALSKRRHAKYVERVRQKHQRDDTPVYAVAERPRVRKITRVKQTKRKET